MARYPKFGISKKTANGLNRSGYFRKHIRPYSDQNKHSDESIVELAGRILRGEILSKEVEAYAAGPRIKFRNQPKTLHPVSSALIEFYGICPKAALGLTLMSDAGLEIMQDVEDPQNPWRIASLNLDNDDSSWITLGDGHSSWRSEEVVIPPVPRTSLAIAIGKPLKEVLSHPVLDQFDLIINEACDVSGFETEIVTNQHPKGIMR